MPNPITDAGDLYDDMYPGVGRLIAEKIVNAVLAQRLYKRLSTQGEQPRRNYIIYGPTGTAKSRIAQSIFQYLIPDSVSYEELGSITPAAAQGTVTEDGKYFIPPSFIKDVIFIGELTSLLNKRNDEIVALMCKAIADPFITVKRAKFAKMKREAVERVGHLGINYNEETLTMSYKPMSCFIGLTHTLDVLENDPMGQALIDRCSIVRVDPPNNYAWRVKQSGEWDYPAMRRIRGRIDAALTTIDSADVGNYHTAYERLKEILKNRYRELEGGYFLQKQLRSTDQLIQECIIPEILGIQRSDNEIFQQFKNEFVHIKRCRAHTNGNKTLKDVWTGNRKDSFFSYSELADIIGISSEAIRMRITKMSKNGYGFEKIRNGRRTKVRLIN